MFMKTIWSFSRWRSNQTGSEFAARIVGRTLHPKTMWDSRKTKMKKKLKAAGAKIAQDTRRDLSLITVSWKPHQLGITLNTPLSMSFYRIESRAIQNFCWKQCQIQPTWKLRSSNEAYGELLQAFFAFQIVLVFACQSKMSPKMWHHDIEPEGNHWRI